MRLDSEDITEPTLEGPDDLVAYVDRLPVILEAAYLAASPLAGGTTADMVEGAHEVIEVVIQILIKLSSWFPENHFGDGSAEVYFSTYVAERATWSRALAEPQGYGNGGTIVRINAAYHLLSEMEDAVKSVVFALFVNAAGDNMEAVNAWSNRWLAASGRVN